MLPQKDIEMAVSPSLLFLHARTYTHTRCAEREEHAHAKRSPCPPVCETWGITVHDQSDTPGIDFRPFLKSSLFPRLYSTHWAYNALYRYTHTHTLCVARGVSLWLHPKKMAPEASPFVDDVRTHPLYPYRSRHSYNSKAQYTLI